MLGGWRLELSRDGTTFMPAASGTFGLADGFRRNAVTPAAGTAASASATCGSWRCRAGDSSDPEFTGARYLRSPTSASTAARRRVRAGYVDQPAGRPRADSSPRATRCFALRRVRGGREFECRLDGGAWTGCPGAAAYTGLAEGATRSRRAPRRRRQHRHDPRGPLWTVDATPPDTAITRPAGGRGDAAHRDVTFAAEAGAAFQCRLDGGAWAPCASPQRWRRWRRRARRRGARPRRRRQCRRDAGRAAGAWRRPRRATR